MELTYIKTDDKHIVGSQMEQWFMREKFSLELQMGFKFRIMNIFIKCPLNNLNSKI